MPRNIAILSLGAIVFMIGTGVYVLMGELAPKHTRQQETKHDSQDEMLVFLDAAGVKELGITTTEVSPAIEDAAIQVPSSAVVNVNGDPYVFVRDFGIPQAFVRVPVETKGLHGKSVVILSGLFPGDDLVVSGAERLDTAEAHSLSSDALRAMLDAAHCGGEHPAPSNSPTLRP